MDMQDFFYIVASVALLLVSALVIFFFYVLYRINKAARTSMESVSFAARDIRQSFNTIADNWRPASLVGAALRFIRLFTRR